MVCKKTSVYLLFVDLSADDVYENIDLQPGSFFFKLNVVTIVLVSTLYNSILKKIVGKF